MIDKAGIYDIPFEEYLGKGLTPAPPLSASVIKTMLNKSPKHAAFEHPDIGGGREEKESTKAAILGTIIHAFVTGEEDKRIIISPFDSFRTDDAKAWKKSQLKNGMIITKQDDYDAAKEMAAAFHENIGIFSKEIGEGFPTKDFEKTVVVQIEDVWCKIRIDALAKNIWDLKTTATNARPEKWTKNQLFREMGYDVNIAFYRRVWKELTGEDKNFIVAVLEQNKPYDSYPVIIGDWGLEKANEQINWAIKTWSEGLKTGKWDGYAAGEVIYALPPAWELAEWEEFKEREQNRKGKTHDV